MYRTNLTNTCIASTRKSATALVHEINGVNLNMPESHLFHYESLNAKVGT